MQMLHRTVARQAVLTDVAELRDPAGLMGFRFAFGGHPLYCFTNGGALQLALNLPASLSSVTEWNMLNHLPWTRCIGFPLRSARRFEDRKGQWTALYLHFAIPGDPGYAVAVAAGPPVQLWMETDVAVTPTTLSTP